MSLMPRTLRRTCTTRHTSHVPRHTSHVTRHKPHLANKNDHCVIIVCSTINFTWASRWGAGATPARTAAVTAGLTNTPLEVGVAVDMGAGVTLLPPPLPAAASSGVLESPAADARPVVEGWGSSDNRKELEPVAAARGGS